MAGDWLKLEANTPEKEEVLAITAAMGWTDADLTVGKLFKLWRWFDQHTTNGNAARVTPALLDGIIGVTGFCEAVRAVGWLQFEGGGITLPKFDRHNGNTAKSRALTAKRVANHKANAKANAEGSAKGNGASVTGALPREREREDNSTPDGVEGGAPKKRGTRKCPDSFALTDDMRDWAVEHAPDVDPDKATAAFRDHTFKNAITDWPGAWRNWLRKDQEFAAERRGRVTTRPQAQSFAERDEAARRRRWEEMTGRTWPTDGSTPQGYVIENEPGDLLAIGGNA